MAYIEFIIPLNRSELLDATDAKYFVRDLLSIKDIPQKLKAARTALKDEGPEYIIDNFETYYSILHHADSLNLNIVSAAYEDLHKAVNTLNNNLKYHLEDKDNLNDELKRKYLTITKMLLYIYITIINFLLTKIEDNNSIMQVKRARTLNCNDAVNNSLNDKEVILLLNNIMQQEINALWSPQLVEEVFVSLIAEVPYRLMQCYRFKLDKELQNLTFHFFGTLVKNYSQGYYFIVRIVQMIKIYEHVGSCIPEGIKLLAEEYNCKSILHDFTKEVTELLSDDKINDNQGVKSCSTVLSELAKCLPSLMLPEIMYLNRYLAHESYTLRISILTIITEVLATVLHKQELSEEDKENRDELLSILEEHIRDINGMVRAKVFSFLARLHEENALPIHKQIEYLERTLLHLRDKVVAVRKSAALCLKTFITHNIFGADLRLKSMVELLEKKNAELNELQAECNSNTANKLKEFDSEWFSKCEDIKAVIEANIETLTEVETMSVDTKQLCEIVRVYIQSGTYLDAFKMCKYAVSSVDKFKEIRKNKDFETEVDMYMAIMRLAFTDFEKIATTIEGSMSENNLTKIVEIKTAIEYFKNVIKYIELINKATPLMSELLESQSVTDMQVAVEFFITAYRFKIDNASDGLLEMLKLIQRNEQDRKDSAINAFKEIYLITDAENMQEHKTIVVERLISLLEMVSYENLPNLTQLIASWSSKGQLDNNIIDMLWQHFTKNPDDKARVSLDLLKMAAMDRHSIISRNIKLISTVAFKERNDDLLLVKSACDAISIVGNKKQLLTDANPPFRIKLDDEIWKDLSDIIITNFMKKKKFILDVNTSIINCIYSLCSKPDKLCETILKTISNNCMNQEKKLNGFILIRLVQLLGDIAIKQFHFLDENVYKEIKRRNYILENKKNNKPRINDSQELRNASATINESVNTGDESVLEGAQAEDADADFILKILENNTVTGNSILSTMTKIIIDICRNPVIYDNKILQTAAATALGRYMIVSSVFCKEHIQLIFTILEKSPHEEVKINVLALCSDLLQRFPNIIEPWVPKLFERLNDKYEVQKTAFFILSNLILKEVIRPQSNISQMTVFIISEKMKLVDMSKQFFTILASKGNILYNILPDIFTHLCNNDIVLQENFFTIMTYLFSLVDKTKYMESLVDRFSIKFRLNDNEIVFKNAAFCLTLITYNEKALKRLLENFPTYKHALHQVDVYTYFKNILNAASKDPKNEMKAIVAEIEDKIKTFFEINDIQTNVLVENKKQRKANSNKKNKKTKGNKYNDDSSGDNTDNSVENTENRRGQKTNKKSKKVNISDDSMNNTSLRRNIRQPRSNRKRIAFSEDSV